MKTEKVLKAIRTIRKLCAEQNDEWCDECLIQNECAKCFIGIPQDWLLEEDKKAQAYMKERRHDGAGNDN